MTNKNHNTLETSTETQHTPGPWEDNGSGLIFGQVSGDDDESPFVADVCNDGASGCYSDQEQANALLISAAPELLKRCEQAQAVMQRAADLLRELDFDDMAIALHFEAQSTREAVTKARRACAVKRLGSPAGANPARQLGRSSRKQSERRWRQRDRRSLRWKGSPRRPREQAGRNASERRAGPEILRRGSRPDTLPGKAAAAGELGVTPRETTLTSGPTGVLAMACL
jgi:hypothetical protein